MDTLSGNLGLLAVIAAISPLLTFLGILLLPGKKERGARLAIVNISFSLLISVYLFFSIWNKQIVSEKLTWFIIGSTEFTAGVLLNNLSVLMLLLVSAIALLVHIYSTRYMKGDPYIFRYWAYLGLFCFSMLALVISDNLLFLYMFWELVGFSSYLLIGFWFTKDTASQASKKAFIMNRLGDLGFLTGIMIVFSSFRTLDISTLFSEGGLVFQSQYLSGIWLTVAGLAFFFGAVAKSAQFPLHTWLPDAMEGPTSVSSLIHAATMVAAGVFLLGRIYPLFDSTVLLIIAAVGAFTAFMAATIAITQNDIKRILAFSTISQLGFMMIAMGSGAYNSGIYHLVTHAFYKCLLFLAAGAVIHEMAHFRHSSAGDFDHQDIRNMGGLRKKMSVTFITMLVASLSLVGMPLTSGFLSKDAILIQAFEWADKQGGLTWMVAYSALFTSVFTAFYIFRLVFKVFFGKFGHSDATDKNVAIHEAPWAMRSVMVVLAVFCLFPIFSRHPIHFQESWILAGLPKPASIPVSQWYHTYIPVLVNSLSILAVAIAYLWYARREKAPDFSRNVLFGFLSRQWLFNELYNRVFVQSTTYLSGLAFRFDKSAIDGIVNFVATLGIGFAAVSRWTDKYIIDGLVNGAAAFAKTIGNFARHFQTGRLQHYLLTMVLVVLTFFIIKLFFPAI